MAGRATGRKVRDLDDARELLAAWRSSGGPLASWCRERGINVYSLSAFRGWHPEVVDAAEMVEIVATPTVVEAAPVYRVLVRDHVVEVDHDFEDEVLRRLIRVVASC